MDTHAASAPTTVALTRADAALAAVRGEPVASIAARTGYPAEVIERWADVFIDAGTARVEGRDVVTSYEQRDRFLALVAHEFRTPIAIIGGWAETLETTDPPAETVRRAMSLIRRQVEHLERVARDALDAAAVATGRLRLVTADIDLPGLCRTVAESLADERIVVRNTPDPRLAIIEGDSTRLKQIVAQMFGTGLRHAGGLPLEVDILIPDEAPMFVEVRVTSRGVEMTFDDAQALFEPFARSDTSRNVGIGLYLARALAVAHGGQVGLRANGVVTELWLRVPGRP